MYLKREKLRAPRHLMPPAAMWPQTTTPSSLMIDFDYM